MQSDLEDTGHSFTICRRIADRFEWCAGRGRGGGGRRDREVIKEGRILQIKSRQQATSLSQV